MLNVAFDCVTGIRGSVEADSPPLVAVAALYVGPGVHDALQLVLLQLPDLLDGAGLLLTVLYSRNNNLSQALPMRGFSPESTIKVSFSLSMDNRPFLV